MKFSQQDIEVHKVCVFLFLALLIFLTILYSVMQKVEKKSPTIIEDVSPNGKYTVQVTGELGEGLLNVPVYVTIYANLVDEDKGVEYSRKIKTQIDNNNGGASADTNVWLVWESETKAVVILMGKEQIPELISISFGQEIDIARTRSSEEARKILQEAHIDTEAIPSYFW